MRKLLHFILLSSVFACADHHLKTEAGKTGDYIVFGDYYGMCAGPRCVRMYLLTESTLFEDSYKRYPSSQKPYEGAFTIDRTSRFNEVKDLLTAIPIALINAESVVLGCPDCSDGGGIYIETKIDGQVKYWLIDKQRVPAGLESFVMSVNQKIVLLQ